MKSASQPVEKKLHIFIADDDLDDIGFFKEAVKVVSKDIRVTVASDGAELIEFLRITSPDIIFLDINMPTMNGIECLAEIRKMKKYDFIPIIIYSTSVNPKNIEQAYELGASMFCLKPAKFISIQKRITEILSKSAKELLPQLSKDEFIIQDSTA